MHLANAQHIPQPKVCAERSPRPTPNSQLPDSERTFFFKGSATAQDLSLRIVTVAAKGDVRLLAAVISPAPC